MISLFRVLLLLLFALFWGGLTFYTGAVVRIIHDVVPDPMEGGLITQRVTFWLQILGATTLLLMIGNAIWVFGNNRGFGIALSVCCVLLTIALIGLFVVHGWLDEVIDVQAAEILDREAFTIGHRRYNQFTTLEWIAALAYLPITIVAWRSIDQRNAVAMESEFNADH